MKFAQLSPVCILHDIMSEQFSRKLYRNTLNQLLVFAWAVSQKRHFQWTP